jgi:hypothetical protein
LLKKNPDNYRNQLFNHYTDLIPVLRRLVAF